MSDSSSSNAQTDQILNTCEAILGHRFQDRGLLLRCLTHSSTAVTRLESNERLEFLGDSILGMIVSEILFDTYPECPEGEMTRIKSAVVSRSFCAKLATELKLDECLFLGKGLTNHSQIPQSVVAGCFEAAIAALYLDGGMETAKTFIAELVAPEIERLAERHTEENFKSRLQQLAQKDFQFTPEYALLDEKGPDHSKSFKVAAIIGDKAYPAAWGRTKKQAEQRAAGNALSVLLGEELPFNAH